MKMANLVKMGFHTVFAHAFGAKLPLNVMLSVTNRCTASCAYCNIPKRNQRELTTSEICALIDQIAFCGCQRLGLWGGEPLIREDIGTIANYARQKNMFVTLDSNGHLLPQRKEVLGMIDHLVLSLDGPEEMHDKNRGSGSFQKVMAALQMAAGKVPLWTITVLTKNNLSGIDHVLALAKEYGFMATFQVIHHNDILGRNDASLFPTDDEYRDAIRKLIFEKKKGAPIASSYKYLNHLLQWKDYRISIKNDAVTSPKCWAGSLYCNIDTEGSVYPCSLLVGKVASKNSIDVGFKDAFKHIAEKAHCTTCAASCFTEYNYLYSLNASTIIEWLSSLVRKNNNQPAVGL